MEEGIWIQADEVTEFMDNLEHVAFLMQYVDDDRAKWKWIILALHNALEGLFVCQLRGNDTIGDTVLDDKSAAALLEKVHARSDEVPWPKFEKLATMTELFRRAKSPKILPPENLLSSSKNREHSIKRVNALRNEFDHFVPKGWSLEISGLPAVMGECCDIIEELAINRPTLHFRVHKHRLRIIELLTSVRELSSQAEAKWSASA